MTPATWPVATAPFATAPAGAAAAPGPEPGAGPETRLRSAEDVLAELLALLPSGWAWPREADSALARLLRGAAAEIARIEAAAAALLAQVDLRAADALLPDYERVLGPDPCGRDLLLTGLDERRRAAHQRWTAGGLQTPAYFEAIAAQLGVPEARVEESRPFVCGGAEAGMELVPPAEVFVWRMHLPPTRVIEFEAGGAEAGAPLGEIVPALVECVIRRLAPAHTTPVFSYPEAA
ncbi:tail protein [Caldovatus sediminis]|uniref:Tail protein n=1 Tax=Caldovatus sediminis TaxID=2041189 RepID=A0A8J3ECA1_9PROT|nr:putative phage tail protein [Caldovatus sediminis]GGG31100.1 tail protein [Caldovatus sediminis]